jgi:hypothetical protein
MTWLKYLLCLFLGHRDRRIAAANRRAGALCHCHCCKKWWIEEPPRRRRYIAARIEGGGK